ncbi:hypothetical protein PoB_001583000 [Plakobranchus ocellatus]|uniref:Uncharacterized protein n=1 Tax=Plakobranchus ocellatus TaxID=259542 RepID=A0AAV3Z2D3_9GAST|nr:hypothetical protein PoB_001583000 [Plakobranchus ocellatus]
MEHLPPCSILWLVAMVRTSRSAHQSWSISCSVASSGLSQWTSRSAHQCWSISHPVATSGLSQWKRAQADDTSTIKTNPPKSDNAFTYCREKAHPQLETTIPRQHNNPFTTVRKRTHNLKQLSQDNTIIHSQPKECGKQDRNKTVISNNSSHSMESNREKRHVLETMGISDVDVNNYLDIDEKFKAYRKIHGVGVESFLLPVHVDAVVIRTNNRQNVERIFPLHEQLVRLGRKKD